MNIDQTTEFDRFLIEKLTSLEFARYETNDNRSYHLTSENMLIQIHVGEYGSWIWIFIDGERVYDVRLDHKDNRFSFASLENYFKQQRAITLGDLINRISNLQKDKQ